MSKESKETKLIISMRAKKKTHISVSLSHIFVLAKPIVKNITQNTLMQLNLTSFSTNCYKVNNNYCQTLYYL